MSSINRYTHAELLLIGIPVGIASIFISSILSTILVLMAGAGLAYARGRAFYREAKDVHLSQ